MLVRTLPLLLLAASILGAADWSGLYESSKLQAEKPRLQKAIDYLLDKEIRPFIPGEQRVEFGLEQFDLPIEAVASDPLGVYSNGRQVELPVPTLLFVEDLARAYGWLWTNRYTTRTMDEYLAMLRYRNPDDFADHRYPTPLAALHIPSDALNDPKVVEMSVQIRRSAYAFLLLHEYGHVRVQELDAKTIRSEVAEEEADTYALDIMKKNSAAPTGLLLIMQSWLFFDAGNTRAEHPVTPKRLEAMAHYLDEHVTEFAQGRPDHTKAVDAIHSIASLLRQAGDYMAIPGHQSALQQLGLRTDVANLKPRMLPSSTK